jgi:hypothetical protein
VAVVEEILDDGHDALESMSRSAAACARPDAAARVAALVEEHARGGT